MKSRNPPPKMQLNIPPRKETAPFKILHLRIPATMFNTLCRYGLECRDNARAATVVQEFLRSEIMPKINVQLKGK